MPEIAPSPDDQGETDTGVKCRRDKSECEEGKVPEMTMEKGIPYSLYLAPSL